MMAHHIYFRRASYNGRIITYKQGESVMRNTSELQSFLDSMSIRALNGYVAQQGLIGATRIELDMLRSATEDEKDVFRKRLINKILEIKNSGVIKHGEQVNKEIAKNLESKGLKNESLYF